MADPSRRELILKAADQLLRHYGLQKTTMADVAREANVGVGTVYLEFPSKDALVEALSRSHYQRIVESMRLASEEAPRAAKERLVRVLEARAVGFLALKEAGAHACDLLCCGSEAVKAAQCAYSVAERELLENILDDGRRDGDFEIRNVELAARALLLAYTAFGPPWIFKLDQKKLGTDIAAMHDLVLHGLLLRTGGKEAGVF